MSKSKKQKKLKRYLTKRIVILGISFLLALIALPILILRIFDPYHSIVALTLYILSWIPLAYGIFVKKILKYKLIILVVLGLLIIGSILWVIFPLDETLFLHISKEDLQEQIELDLSLVPVYIEGIETAFLDIEKNKKLFQSSPEDLTFEEKEKLLELWSVYLDYVLELEKLKEVHKHFYQINYLKYSKLNLRSFLIGYSAFITNHKHALLLQNLIGNNKFMEVLLNEERIDFSIPKDAYFYIKQGNTHPETLIQLNAGYANLQFLKSTKKLTTKTEEYLITYSDNGYKDAYKIGGKTPERFVQNPADYFEKKTFNAWFPFQVAGSKGISMVRTALRENFITVEQIQEIRKELEPGDIVLQRRNWYLTNIGLPGFWPHSAMFIGSLDEMDSYFKDISLLEEISASEYIKRNYPNIYNELKKKDADGYLLSVIESKRPGVILKSLEDSATADYLSVLRPKISKEDKFKAILISFDFYGRPYDFNFDFITDNEVVCSELVYKAYIPKKDKEGINFELIKKAGRLVLPPNDIAKKFDEEHGTNNQELDFVLFIDGSEENQNSIRKNVEEFKKTWKRPKWDLVQA